MATKKFFWFVYYTEVSTSELNSRVNDFNTRFASYSRLYTQADLEKYYRFEGLRIYKGFADQYLIALGQWKAAYEDLITLLRSANANYRNVRWDVYEAAEARLTQADSNLRAKALIDANEYQDDDPYTTYAGNV